MALANRRTDRFSCLEQFFIRDSSFKKTACLWALLFWRSCSRGRRCPRRRVTTKCQLTNMSADIKIVTEEASLFFLWNIINIVTEEASLFFLWNIQINIVTEEASLFFLWNIQINIVTEEAPLLFSNHSWKICHCRNSLIVLMEHSCKFTNEEVPLFLWKIILKFTTDEVPLFLLWNSLTKFVILKLLLAIYALCCIFSVNMACFA